MNRLKNTSRAMRNVRLLLLGSVSWLVCGIALPSNQGMDAGGLMAKVSNLVIAQAIADNNGKNGNSDNSSSDKSGNSDNSGSDKSSSESSDKSSSDKSSGESSSSSSATLVCESRDSVLSSLGLTSSDKSSNDKSGNESSDKSSSSDKSGNSDNSSSDKSGNSDNSGSDKSGNSDNSSSDKDNNDGKVTICHIPPGNPSQRQTITVDQSAVSAHMAHGDSMGACSGVTQSYIESLPTCAAIVGAGSSTVTGVWVPEGAIGNSTALNDFYTQVQAGSAAATPFEQAGNDTSQKSYREIRGQ
jgi:hypothetical protein